MTRAGLNGRCPANISRSWPFWLLTIRRLPSVNKVGIGVRMPVAPNINLMALHQMDQIGDEVRRYVAACTALPVYCLDCLINDWELRVKMGVKSGFLSIVAVSLCDSPGSNAIRDPQSPSNCNHPWHEPRSRLVSSVGLSDLSQRFRWGRPFVGRKEFPDGKHLDRECAADSPQIMGRVYS